MWLLQPLPAYEESKLLQHDKASKTSDLLSPVSSSSRHEKPPFQTYGYFSLSLLYAFIIYACLYGPLVLSVLYLKTSNHLLRFDPSITSSLTFHSVWKSV